MPMHFTCHLIGQTLCGHMLAYLHIHLSSLRLDHFLCSHVHAPHIPLAFVYHMFSLALMFMHSTCQPFGWLYIASWCHSWAPILIFWHVWVIPFSGMHIFSYPCPLQISISFYFSLVYCTVDYVTWLVHPKELDMI